MHFDIQAALINVLLLWILTAPHEFSHAWVAMRLGDDTPVREGRVTLNPLAHVDWVGTAILPFITSALGLGFLGWGKPVRSDPSKLRGGLNGLALVSLAGPASNVVMAVILAIVTMLVARISVPMAQFAQQGVTLSLYLALFNMLPVPPLDGSKLLLAARIPWKVYAELSRVGFILLVLAMSYTDIGHYLNRWSFEGARAIFWMVR